ncbi:hypothetical protein DV738_g5552, partial [Chaetothyriales sp. CBS 135597]
MLLAAPAPASSGMKLHHHSDDGPLTVMAVAWQDDTSSDWSSFVGIATAIVGNILISFALNVQRYAHVRLKEESDGKSSGSLVPALETSRIQGYGAIQQDDIAAQALNDIPTASHPAGTGLEATLPLDYSMQESFESEEAIRPRDDKGEDGGRKSYLRSKIWWAGIIMMTVGEVGNFLAYGFAPASIVSPLGVVALVCNCLIAPLFLKEPFRQRDFWGVVVAILGAITVVLSANQNEAKLDPDLLWNYYMKRWEFLVYVLITAIAIVALMIASPEYGKRTLAIDIALVGLFGGYTAIATKGVAALLSASLYKAFTFPIFYSLVLLLVFSAIMQIRYLNKALQNFNSTQVIPTQFVCFTLSVIIGSAVLYREFESETTSRAIEFVAGCLLTFFGVYLITSKSRPDGGNEKGLCNQDSDELIHLVDESEEATENTALRGDLAHKPVHPHDDRLPELAQSLASAPFPVTPPRSPPAPDIPSIAVTPSETPVPLGTWNQSTPALPHPRTPASQSLSDIGATPYFTPSTSTRHVLRTTESSPADVETPTRLQRTTSLPKPGHVVVNAFDGDRRKFLRSTRDGMRVLIPGPLLPPLASSPLSGIVAESLRRGENSPIPVRKRLRRSATLRHDRPHDVGPGGEGHGMLRQMSEEGDLPRSPTTPSQASDDVSGAGNGDGNVGQRQSRLRAMSETLGLLIKGSDWSTRNGDRQARGG